jgi:hypothetical protein
MYDHYNFSSAWYKQINPAGWIGTSFDSFGYWRTGTAGEVGRSDRSCCGPAQQGCAVRAE